MTGQDGTVPGVRGLVSRLSLPFCPLTEQEPLWIDAEVA
jgi:hypothetical protein